MHESKLSVVFVSRTFTYLALVLALHASGCGGTVAVPTACAVNGDCNDGHVCVANSCRAGVDLAGPSASHDRDASAPSVIPGRDASSDDPCWVPCNDPPEAVCDSHGLTTYSTTGTCAVGAEGTCIYAPTTTLCPLGCLNGECIKEPCDGVRCVTPPAASCVDATTQRTYVPSGTCARGECSYLEHSTPCPAPDHAAGVCTAGACGFACNLGYTLAGAACVLAHNAWSRAASLSTRRAGAAAVTGPDGRIYAIAGCGENCAELALASVEAYAPATDTWAFAPSLLQARAGHTAAVGANGRIYVIGGLYGVATVEEYTPGMRAWMNVADLPSPRALLAAAVGVDGRIYVLGGTDQRLPPYTPVTTVEVYTPSTNTWATAANMQTPRLGLTAAAGADGRIFAIGGDTLGGHAGTTTTVEAYSPATNTWAIVASMTVPRSGHAAAIGADGRIFAVGGYSGPQSTASAEAYTPSTNTWAPIADLPIGGSSLAAAVVGATLYLVGGGGRNDIVWRYTP